MVSGNHIGRHRWSGVSRSGDRQAGDCSSATPTHVWLQGNVTGSVTAHSRGSDLRGSLEVEVLPARLANSSSFTCGTGGGHWGARILEKLLTKLPIGPKSWEGNRTKSVGAERGFGDHTRRWGSQWYSPLKGTVALLPELQGHFLFTQQSHI